ncbi:biotin transporter BioY [Trichococcus ilyis]|uniref:Biotin transporter n=1 Tax=Trichococcus ilyis TaxID=640938 RepID=A0A143YPG9_9LACT|nr:biotin transporter BioY [Trichococcus ilyis]CZQ95255.1 bioy protein [Trichococcus ilyis]SEJ08012.1 biotin transport system substrate-specific component [Trichococcus ilyis]
MSEKETVLSAKTEKRSATKLSTKEMVLCALFAALIAVGAFIHVPVPVVPFTLQFLFTLLAGVLLGGRLGATSVSLYVLMGLAGLPVFAEGGGIGYILKPSFGYLIGFCVGTYVTGIIAHKAAQPSFRRVLLAGLAGLGIVYVFGLIYYYLLCNYVINTPIAMGPLFLYGFLLSVPGDIALCFLGASLGKRLIPAIRKGL